VTTLDNPTAEQQILQQIMEHAYRSVEPSRLGKTNLSVDESVREEGESLGPEIQGITVDRSTIVVFADDQPLANFAHPCRYLLYDPATAEHYASHDARFPLWTNGIPESLQPFHTPVQPTPPSSLFHVRPPFRAPILLPDGKRYAIFYSGMSETRHLNDMEFGYRTLIHRYGFQPADITVLSWDGTTETLGGGKTVWPGDGTEYQIRIDAEGTQSAFESAIDDLKPKLNSGDLLFIHTNNHGDWDGTESYICQYPSGAAHTASDFCAKLAELPEHRSLIVMMEQCNSGGFIKPIVSASTAQATSVACAATAFVSSWSTSDGNWDAFAYQWFAAQAGAYPSGAALAFNPDTDGDNKIEATGAYNYANLEDDTDDTPQYGDSGTAGGEISLGRGYTNGWWPPVLREVLEPRYLELPPAEYQEELRKLEPQLQELIRTVDDQSNELREETRARLREIVGPHSIPRQTTWKGGHWEL
jgi:Peptidase C13 family